MTQLMDPHSADLSHLKRLQKQDTAAGPAWLDDLSRAGMARFTEAGFPTTKQEEWRFTNVAPIARTKFRLAGPEEDRGAREALEQATFGREAAAELVFVNGHYRPEWSRPGRFPKGFTLLNLADAIESKQHVVRSHLGQYAEPAANPFTALNTGFLHDGVLLHIEMNVTVEGPIHLLFISTGAENGGEPIVSHPRILVVAEANSEVTFVKSFVGTPGPHWCNPVSEIYAAADARIDRVVPELVACLKDRGHADRTGGQVEQVGIDQLRVEALRPGA